MGKIENIVNYNHLDRTKVHDFLDVLLDGKDDEEALATLKEIVVEYWFEIKDDENMHDICIDVSYIVDQHGKIHAIKYVREETGLGLKSAKTFVESVMAGNTPDFSEIYPKKLYYWRKNILLNKMKGILKDYGKI